MSEEKIKCPECGKEVTKNRVILTCPNCGMTFCSECMEQQPKGTQHCSSCGAEIVKKQDPKVNPRPDNTPKLVKPIKISDLAKEINVNPEFICDYISRRGYGYYAPVSIIPDSMANEVRHYFQKTKPPRGSYRPEDYIHNPGDWPVKRPPQKTSLWKKFKNWLGIGKK